MPNFFLWYQLRIYYGVLLAFFIFIFPLLLILFLSNPHPHPYPHPYPHPPPHPPPNYGVDFFVTTGVVANTP